MGILSETVSYIPNILELVTQLQIGRNTLLMLLQHLEQASLNKTGKGFSTLPAAIQTALKGKKVKEAAMITKGGKTIYEAEVGEKDLMFDAQGRQLSTL